VYGSDKRSSLLSYGKKIMAAKGFIVLAPVYTDSFLKEIAWISIAV
jgi:hypothetical protein